MDESSGILPEGAHLCPVCGQPCAILYGCGWDYDLIICPCGYELELETSTEFDYQQ